MTLMNRSAVLVPFFLLVLATSLFAIGLANLEQSSLLGYRLGMSLEEAEAIRPFSGIKSHPPGFQETQGSFVGNVSDLTLDDIPLECYVTFVENRITKVVASFEIAALIQVKWILDRELGPGKEETTAKHVAGELVSSTAIRWKLADALLELTVFPQTSKRFMIFLMALPNEK